MHTELGRSMGRDFKHFLKEGSRVENELAVKENYKSRLLELIDKVDQNESQKVNTSFMYNSWQA